MADTETKKNGRGKNDPTKVWNQYERGRQFNNRINLNDTVQNNENFFIGKQWEGVKSNGLPTPVFNMLKRIVLFQVASTATDNIKIFASPISSVGAEGIASTELFCNILNAQFDSVWESTGSAKKFREFMRDSAVRGDGCMYSYFDPDMETGQKVKGGIRTELLENTRVFFGNPTDREVQRQPYIIIERREMIEEVKHMVRQNGGDASLVKPDSANDPNIFSAMEDDKVTLLYRFRRDRETGTIWCGISTKDMMVREEWDTEQTLYPIAWMSWDYVTGCYHGQASVTGLIPNQIFVNKMFAMVYISLMTTAYPKVVYDKTRVSKWNNAVGAAIPVNGGDINTVAKTIDPATISPQVSQFIELTVNMTKDLMGATDAALGSTRPDNTSAIIALQKAANVPMELVKQNFFQCIEDTARIWADLMRVYYGKRIVEMDMPQATGATQIINPDGNAKMLQNFDFGMLATTPINLKIDVGGTAYYSEIAQIQTLDNLLMNNKISTVEYLKRLPNGYMSHQNELIQKLEEQERLAAQAQAGAMQQAGGGKNMQRSGVAAQATTEALGGRGYGQIQRNLINAAVEGSGR